MKRFLAALLALLLLIPASGMAAVDLSSLSWQQLQALDQQLAKEMASRPEWKEVVVPPGVYEIGVDIPAGYWDVTLKDKDNWVGAYVYYCSTLDRSRTIWADDDSLIAFAYLGNDGPTQAIMLDEGNWVIIVSNSVVFTPYSRPKLGF
jgi:hypothetical protein